MSSMVWNIGLNSSIKAVKSSMVFIFSKYLRKGFKYLTVSLASRHAVLTSFNSLKQSNVKDVIHWVGNRIWNKGALRESQACIKHVAQQTAKQQN